MNTGMSSIVGVKFQNKFDSTFCGREYHYRTALELAEDDLVIAPTTSGERLAQVTSVNVPDSKIDERNMPALKTIETAFRDEDIPF